MGFESTLIWYCSVLEDNTSETVSTDLTIDYYLTNSRLKED